MKQEQEATLIGDIGPNLPQAISTMMGGVSLEKGTSTEIIDPRRKVDQAEPGAPLALVTTATRWAI